MDFTNLQDYIQINREVSIALFAGEGVILFLSMLLLSEGFVKRANELNYALPSRIAGSLLLLSAITGVFPSVIIKIQSIQEQLTNSSYLLAIIGATLVLLGVFLLILRIIVN
ncbi:MAG: hypothetical protein HGN29_15035 [Asgard group archaeon]|nr:hypothetical protein [Asgard group archaeon]